MKVLGDAERRNGRKYVRCLCECGVEFESREEAIKNGRTKTCGHRKGVVAPGTRYGYLTALEDVGGRYHEIRWECDCGVVVVRPLNNVKSGRTQTCGECPLVSRHGYTRTRHGRTQKDPTYSSWIAMRQRCLNPNSVSYARYGGRGIKICQRWLSFEAFLSDLGERPSGMTLDRIDNDGDYEPSNTRWATPAEQAHGTSLTKLSEEKVAEIRRRLASGETQLILQQEYGVSSSLMSRINTNQIWKV